MSDPARHTATDADALIIGGGLAGLTAAILLADAGKKVLLLEKKKYPFHKVCGEYVSNEVLPFLQSLGFDPFAYGASRITKLRISTPRGKNIYPALGTGGFGLSRYTMDQALAQLAERKGATVLAGTRAAEIVFNGERFFVTANTGEVFSSKLLIGSYGKRDVLDKLLHRGFIRDHTGYLAVKYHLETDYPADEIGLDNFEGGYCGIVKVEKNRFNLCYLYRRKKRERFSSIAELEENTLFKNPVLKAIFSNARMLLPKPEAINEVSFASKTAVEAHTLMCGDSAGLIAPLCGNGMSMAVHAARLLCEEILSSGILEKSAITLRERDILEKRYAHIWEKHFRRRLLLGKMLQACFRNPFLAGLSLHSLHALPALERWVIANTHGKTVPAWQLR